MCRGGTTLEAGGAATYNELAMAVLWAPRGNPNRHGMNGVRREEPGHDGRR